MDKKRLGLTQIMFTQVPDQVACRNMYLGR